MKCCCFLFSSQTMMTVWSLLKTGRPGRPSPASLETGQQPIRGREGTKAKAVTAASMQRIRDRVAGGLRKKSSVTFFHRVVRRNTSEWLACPRPFLVFDLFVLVSAGPGNKQETSVWRIIVKLLILWMYSIMSGRVPNSVPSLSSWPQHQCYSLNICRIPPTP